MDIHTYTQEELDSQVANAVSEAIKDWESRYNNLNIRYESQVASTQRDINLAKETERRWFAESVMEYEHGTPECRYAFLQEIELEDYVPSRTYTFTLTVTASWEEDTGPSSMLDDLKSALDAYNVEIDSADYDTED